MWNCIFMFATLSLFLISDYKLLISKIWHGNTEIYLIICLLKGNPGSMFSPGFIVLLDLRIIILHRDVFNPAVWSCFVTSRPLPIQGFRVLTAQGGLFFTQEYIWKITGIIEVIFIFIVLFSFYVFV